LFQKEFQNMPSASAPVDIKWTRIVPGEDPNHPDGKPCTRSSHGVSMVQSKTKLFIYGGETVARTPLDPNQSTWICDFTNSSPKWRSILVSSSSAQQPPARVAHAQAVYKDRYVYIFGGRAGITMDEMAMNDLWVFDTETETWTECTSTSTPPEARSFHQMLCVDDALYVFGGCSAVHGRLADIHKFDIATKTWTSMGTSQHLRGRGGATFLPFNNGKSLGVVAGFAGEETNDGHVFDVTKGQWNEDALTKDLTDLRPRSVCVGGSFPSVGLTVIFGGEVDPSQKGHEGAGGFANDVVVLNESNGNYITTIPSKQGSDEGWPEIRGWSSGAAVKSYDGSIGQIYVFGGLSGDDTSPERLDDLWRLDISKKA